jgi:hypothetical protein
MTQETQHGGVRVALEGCVSLKDPPQEKILMHQQGHGKLHDIYAKVTESAAAKGWSGVDLVIIGGDFQASFQLLQLLLTRCPLTNGL